MVKQATLNRCIRLHTREDIHSSAGWQKIAVSGQLNTVFQLAGVEYFQIFIANIWSIRLGEKI